jgi:hypothetical protein
MKSIDYSKMRFDSAQEKPLASSTSYRLITPEFNTSEQQHEITRVLLHPLQLEQ